MRRDPLLPEEYGRPWLLVLAGLAVLAITASAAAPVAVAGWLDRVAYVRATPCSPAVREECVVDRLAIVTAYRITGSRSSSHDVTFDLDGREVVEDLADPDEVWNALRRGIEVDVRLWEGDVTRVTVGERTTETNASPVVLALEGTGFLLAGAGVGLGLLLSGAARLRWRRLPLGPMPERARGMSIAYGLGVGGLTVVLLANGLDVFAPLPVLAVAGVAAVVPYVVLRGEP